MKIENKYKERGQTLVQVAILLTVLLAFLALAIDVGWMYAGRRQMQNAADAGALAGAYDFCFGTETEAGARAAALEYAVNRNGAQWADVTIVDTTVNVVAWQTVDLAIADVIGLPQVDVPAEAAAACGAAESACGLWPVTIEQWKWEELLDPNKGRACINPFYVWTGDNENNNPDCTIYDCDVNDDGFRDVIEQVARGWVDFTDVVDPESESCAAPGCGEHELECWIRANSKEEVIVGDCMPGVQGVKAGAKDGVDSRIGDNVSIPLFDGTCDTSRTCPGGNKYHISGFGCITVLGWIHDLRLPRLDGANPPWSGKVIQAAINCPGCFTYCGFTKGKPKVEGGVNAVSLIK